MAWRHSHPWILDFQQSLKPPYGGDIRVRCWSKTVSCLSFNTFCIFLHWISLSFCSSLYSIPFQVLHSKYGNGTCISAKPAQITVPKSGSGAWVNLIKRRSSWLLAAQPKKEPLGNVLGEVGFASGCNDVRCRIVRFSGSLLYS